MPLREVVKCEAEQGAGKAKATFPCSAAWCQLGAAALRHGTWGVSPADAGTCSSQEALQTAQGKIFNSASHFNLKSEKN